MTARVAVIATLAGLLWQAPPAPAQTPRGGAARPAQGWRLRPFADGGIELFTANDSFRSIFGRPWGLVWGGGVMMSRPSSRWFVAGRVGRFADTGRRVFVLGTSVFDLGIPDPVSITPVEASLGYRLASPARRRPATTIPYVGGGIGWHLYREGPVSPSGDGTHTTRTGAHLLAGVERPLGRRLSGAVEVQWSTVPRAIGRDTGSVGALFDEHDLGGVTFRARVILGQ